MATLETAADRETTLHVVRVFVGARSRWGNALGVFVDGASVRRRERQHVARSLGFSETVFVDSAENGVIAIFGPARELPFAGHPTVGSAWLLERLGYRVDVLKPPAGEVATWREGDVQWIRARPEWVHQITFEQLGSPSEVEAIAGPPAGEASYYCWSWFGDSRRVRSRYFAPALGVDEDEATGGAAVLLAARVGRQIEVLQGRGSRIYARPREDGMVDVGGRCCLDEVRLYGLRPAHHMAVE